ncbi:Uma2 family endonuclease [Nonomuraea sp. MCN248]|uniref:Uma2 family endonuclease n=2 Tax=Nonomuraea corallina TaxID=2989783 RepID=A0ABT4SLJ7_9ACTN|nr:Uma2 family endonuclease [Nonomuraea corallina]MDA0637984.1 Uma2 family endonuclease [Nonomuraea corallina]
MAPESSLPDWIFPPPEGFTAEDLDHLPHLPAHTELIDGSLVLVSPQASFHTRTVDLLVASLRRTVPSRLRIRREMSIILAEDQRPEPDISVIHAEADESPEQTYYRARDVLLTIEVVSPESRSRDRRRKPLLYAEAGIPHFWRVENDSGRPVVYVYELDPATCAYVPTGIHRDRVKVTVPFDADIDLAEIDTY